ncbi:MAG: cytochrome oxidase [Labilithrix sp.]|nr:cytochrome oxidase [Labilithrix sp.]MCW5812521.1 cytochrome oxidase [Labilithrix sp.]
MDILIMQVFVSLGLVAGSVLLFLFTTKQRDFDHADRLALLPLEDKAENKKP